MGSYWLKRSIMTYNGKQLTALLKMGIVMASADEKFADEEKEALTRELASFGVTAEQAMGLTLLAKDMEPDEAISILSEMSEDQKKYATGYLAVIMVSDGEITESEKRVWQVVSTLCSFPTMSLGDALKFWTEH